MKTFTISVLLLVLFNTCIAQTIPQDSLYLGQAKPNNNPKVFILPIQNGLRPIERIAVSNDGKEIYYSGLNTYPATNLAVFCFKYENNRWQGPFTLFTGFMAPALSPNDSILYIQENVTYDIAYTYYCVRTATGWSTPVKLFSFSQQSHYTQKTNLNNYYTSTNFPGSSLRDLGKVIISGNDTSVTSLGLPINTAMDESDFFIAKDESYIIHARHTATIAGDLFISYKKINGGWTNSKSLGSNINLPNPTWEYGIFVTQDNKYMFFTRGDNSWSSYYTYWVKIDNIIDSLKHTNFIPYLRTQIPNRTDSIGVQFSYTIPDTTFIDDDGNNTLTYSATLSNGSPLPAWISFNPATRTFTGNPTAIGTSLIKVTVTDTDSAKAWCTFSIDVAQHTAIDPTGEQIIKEYKLYQNYPNPFNPSTVISYALPGNSFVSLKIYSILGKEIASLVNSVQKRGVYDLVLNAGTLNLSSGMYLYALTATETNTNKVFKESKIMNYIK